MQILKEDIKQKIIQEATKEISEKTFEKASMRDIAKNAGITVGNVYRYFESKEALLDEILAPLVQELEKIIFAEYEERDRTLSIEKAMNLVKQVYQRRQQEFLILLEGAGTEKYNQERIRLRLLIQERMQKECKEPVESYLIELMAENLLYNASAIMKTCGKEEKRLSMLLQGMIEMMTAWMR